MIDLLIVDDQIMMRNLIKRIHGDSIFKVVGQATNGLEAIQMAKDLSPDVITMDITMEGVDGLEATRQIIEHDPYVMILIVSALSDSRTAREARKLGAKGIVTKPFNEQDIKVALEKLID